LRLELHIEKQSKFCLEVVSGNYERQMQRLHKIGDVSGLPYIIYKVISPDAHGHPMHQVFRHRWLRKLGKAHILKTASKGRI
jgi:hypothetical protein